MGPGASLGAETASRGQTTIADSVVARVIIKIVDLVVADVEGVYGLLGDSATDAVADPAAASGFDDEDAADSSVSVKLDDGQAEINISIEVEFGYAVHEVVEKIRARVISQAERQLGLTVTEVNVLVAGVNFDDAD